MRPHAPVAPAWWPARHQIPSVARRLAVLVVAVAVLFGCGATSTIVTQGSGGGHTPTTGTATSTTTSSTGNGPHATPTHTPVPPPQSPPPTATKVPTAPNIAGTWGGSYTEGSYLGNMPMTFQLTQSNQSISGTTHEGSEVLSDAGTMALNGSFILVETLDGTLVANFVGSVLGFGHIGGTWNYGGATAGNWAVYNPPRPANIAGSYAGGYSTNGLDGSTSMGLTLSQTGQSLSGTAYEPGATLSDTGSIALDGSFTIYEYIGGSYSATLWGQIDSPGKLSGTWGSGTSVYGTWQVSLP